MELDSRAERGDLAKIQIATFNDLAQLDCFYSPAFEVSVLAAAFSLF